MSISRHGLSLLCVSALLLAFSCQPVQVDNPAPEPEPEPEVVYDGAVTRLMKATKGKGLDIVLMGDGFTLEDHEDGTYDAAMQTACRHIFSNRPVSDLKDYFNVYSVGVVSENRNLDGTSGLKCRGTNPGDEGTERIIDSYGAKVEGVVVDSTVFCIIVNIACNGGWCTHASYDTQKAYAYVPLIPSSHSNNAYRLALIHETIGHGFAKLGDEYTMNGYASVSPTKRDITSLSYSHNHWYDLNITYSTDPETCPWKDFLEDERYSSERIGFYEGVGYFGKGAYHPTSKNIMNVTTGVDQNFNAPGRKVIYDRVMRRAEGRIPSYEEFVKFDKKL